MDQKGIQQLIEEFLRKLTVTFDSIEVLEDGAHPVFLITSGDSRLLIGNNGDNLRSLNILVKKIVERKTPGEVPHFLLDVNGYYRRRIQELKDHAMLLAERARTFRADVEMNPMNAYERMIVHSFFAEHPHIKTSSVGVGRFRHVVLKYQPEEERTITSDREFNPESSG